MRHSTKGVNVSWNGAIFGECTTALILWVEARQCKKGDFVHLLLYYKQALKHGHTSLQSWMCDFDRS